jgi:hypothetical protein
MIGEFAELLLWQEFTKALIGAFHPFFDAVHQMGPQGQAANEISGNGVFDQFTESKIVAVKAIDAVAMAEQIALGVLPPGAMGAPGKCRGMASGEEKLVITLHETDLTAGLLPLAPGQEPAMQGLFIAWQRYPEIENVAQKNHIPGALFQRFQHLEKCVAIALRPTNMGIRNDHHRGMLRIGGVHRGWIP